MGGSGAEKGDEGESPGARELFLAGLLLPLPLETEEKAKTKRRAEPDGELKGRHEGILVLPVPAWSCARQRRSD
jgi:hypothetical protein